MVPVIFSMREIPVAVLLEWVGSRTAETRSLGVSGAGSLSEGLMKEFVLRIPLCRRGDGGSGQRWSWDGGVGQALGWVFCPTLSCVVLQ